jgi:hypothetical protein
MRRYVGRCQSCKSGVARDVVGYEQELVKTAGDGMYARAVRETRFTAGEAQDGCSVSSVYGVRAQCGCGGFVSLEAVRGTYKAGHKCDARCLNATGPSCECECGGANHGANHA